MSYKTILVQIDSDKRCVARVEIAIRLAKQQDAHLVALYAQAPFVLPGYLVHVGPEVIEAQKKAAAEEMARAEADFSKQALTLGLNNAEWRTAIDYPVEAVLTQAQYADLVVVGQNDPGFNAIIAENLPARLVPAAGRPLLIVPYAGDFPILGSRILVAWNGSREAARVITDALPLLKLADKVNVMAIQPKHDENASLSVNNLIPYLARQGVHVEVTTEHVADIDVGNELLTRAADLGADLLVMGGYGHSRLREWVLGGATRTILESMTVPVLMSH